MFRTGVVVHYVSEYSKKEINKIHEVLSEPRKNKRLKPSITNDTSFSNLIENLPIGTIICKLLREKKQNRSNEQFLICLPMFSSHVSMPVKINEVIWFIEDLHSPYLEEIEEGLPLLTIRFFWLSRKIGSKISEDLNYSYYQRDALITSVTNDEETNNITVPDFRNNLNFQNTYGNIVVDNEDVYEKEKNSTFYPGPVPRWFSKHYELTLHGSNNSLINLTNTNSDNADFFNKGAIDIVAGRHTISDFSNENESNTLKLQNKTIDNLNDSEERLNQEIKLKRNSFAKIKNASGELETLKNQKYYLGKEFIDETKEGLSSLENDASRIYITEFDEVDNFLYCDMSWFDFQDNIIFDMLNKSYIKKNTAKIKNYLPEEKNIIRDNLSTTLLKKNNYMLPSILLKSNNLRFVARKKYEDTENQKVLNEGSIRLIKESKDFLNYSHLCLEDSGQILIDGNTILLGNFKKEAYRQKVINVEDAKKLKDKKINFSEDKFKSMHGQGGGLLIGHEENLAEPLVLGNTLESMIKEILHINIKLLEEVENITDEFLNHTHAGVFPGKSTTFPPNSPLTSLQVALSNSHVDGENENLKNRCKALKDNLKDMLSRFAKTT